MQTEPCAQTQTSNHSEPNIFFQNQTMNLPEPSENPKLRTFKHGLTQDYSKIDSASICYFHSTNRTF